MVAPLPITLHDTNGWATAPPLESLPVAVKCTTSPVRVWAASAFTLRFATGFLDTERLTTALVLEEVARSLAWPGRRPLTAPALSTLAIDGVSEVQVMGALLWGSPFELRAVATRISEAPTTNGVGAAISTLAGGAAETVILA